MTVRSFCQIEIIVLELADSSSSERTFILARKRRSDDVEELMMKERTYRVIFRLARCGESTQAGKAECEDDAGLHIWSWKR